MIDLLMQTLQYDQIVLTGRLTLQNKFMMAQTSNIEHQPDLGAPLSCFFFGFDRCFSSIPAIISILEVERTLCENLKFSFIKMNRARMRIRQKKTHKN